MEGVTRMANACFQRLHGDFALNKEDIAEDACEGEAARLCT